MKNSILLCLGHRNFDLITVSGQSRGRSRGRGSKWRMCFWWDDVVFFLIVGLRDGWRYARSRDVGKHGVVIEWTGYGTEY